MASGLRIDISPFLKTYQVDPERGFLPERDPLDRLGPAFLAWEEAMNELPDRLSRPGVRAWLTHLPEFPARLLEPSDCERAFLLLGMLCHAYLHGEEMLTESLPAFLARPWVAIAERLGRPPVLSHASVVLQNWRKIDPNQGFQVENLAPLLTFRQTPDEGWFYMIAAAIEAKGAKAISELAAMLRAAKEDQPELIEETLQEIVAILPELTLLLSRMGEQCDPVVFYQTIRPYLASVRAVRYEGSEELPVRTYAGGSAAQSSLLQALEAGLGLPHEEPGSANFLRSMRQYMPPAHRSFLSSMERLAPTFLDMCEEYPQLYALRLQAAQEMKHFRNGHLQLVSRYIVAHQATHGPGQLGTGGTDPLPFLRQLRNDSANVR